MQKKEKSTKSLKPKNSLLRMGIPLFLAVIMLWNYSMAQITTSSAERMVNQLPQKMQLLARFSSDSITNIYHPDEGGFDGKTPLQEIEYWIWAEYLYNTVEWQRDSIIDPFPSWVNPFLLDLTGFEFLPDDLQYSCQLGIAIASENGTPLLTTGNLMKVEEPEGDKYTSNYGNYNEELKQRLMANDSVTIFANTYSNIGEYVFNHIRFNWTKFENFAVWQSTDRDSPYRAAIYKDQLRLDDDTYVEYGVGVLCQPMPYCMLRLIPFYCITFVAAILLVYLYLLFIKRKLLDPLREQAVAMEQHLPPLTQEELDSLLRSRRWAEPATARSHVIRLQKIKAEMTRMETALDYAKDAEENRKQLISNITHELKTPLAVIHSYAEGLQSGIATEKKGHYVEVILDETDRMDAMVLQMLELSRLEAGRVKITLENFSFSDLIRYVTEKFQPLLDAKNLTVRMSLVEPLTIHASESRLEQVLTNYLSNAVKYTPEGGQIKIHAACNPKNVFFNITNTAPHLSKESLEKVYDSFYREESSRSTKSTGLGLAIVKGIISLHSGECFVTNTELDGESAVHFGFQIPR